MSTHISSSGSDTSSGSKRPFPNTPNERRVQPRHFHAGPRQETVSSAVRCATMKGLPHLYRDALASIFRFLGQLELTMALQVSHSWLAAANAMPVLQLTFERPSVPLCVVAQSAMGRHVTHVGTAGQYVAVTADSLFVLTRHMVQLRTLFCELQQIPSQGPLAFPLGLREMTLQLNHMPSAADVNAVFTTISRLSVLSIFVIHLPKLDVYLSFSPLKAMAQLRSLVIHLPNHILANNNLSDVQVDELRVMSNLVKLHINPTSVSVLRRLLIQPNELQVQDIRLPRVLDDEVSALLLQLPPSLTTFRGSTSCSRFDFFQRLPNLTLLSLQLIESNSTNIAESLLTGLKQCVNIETFGFCCTGLTAAYLRELLSFFPRLHTFAIRNGTIDTLSFLVQQPLSRQLTRLDLTDCKRLPLTELRHVHSLSGLETLRIQRSFDGLMDVHCQSLYTPPSLLLPQLQKFDYKQ